MGPLANARARVRADPAQAWLLLLVMADVTLVWALPLLVGQDLPQHLAYARILADYGDPALPFRATFVLPTHAQPYFTAYLILAPLTRLTSVLTACRLVYTAYVVTMAAGFTSLVKAVHGGDLDPRRTPWAALFGPLLAWNPVQCVGFLPFMLALPAALYGVACMLRVSERATRGALAKLTLAVAVTASLHLVAGASLVLFATLHAVFRRSRAAFGAAAVTLVAAVGTLAAWRLVGERGLAEMPAGLLAAAVARDGLWEGTAAALGAHWSTLAERWALVVATVVGPLANGAKLLVASAILALAVVVHGGAREPGSSGVAPARRPYALAVLGFLAAVVATPTSLVLPEDICLLDFRLYVVAFLLAVALVTPRVLASPRARVALPAFAILVLGVWTRQLAGAAGEASSVVRLVSRLGPRDTLLALPFHDRSAYLDAENSVTHYFPVYNTALGGGVTSLFWGKFSQHLPVGYRPGHEPPRPPDWDPARFTREQLLASTHVLVEWPDDDDGDLRLYAAEHLRQELRSGFTSLACDGRWCLYRAPARAVSDREEARR